MDDLYKIKLCDLLKAEFDCACGKKHMINAEVRYGGEEELKKVLSEIAPNGKTAFISLAKHVLYLRRRRAFGDFPPRAARR